MSLSMFEDFWRSGYGCSLPGSSTVESILGLAF
jgi:hypothetical protein